MSAALSARIALPCTLLQRLIGCHYSC